MAYIDTKYLGKCETCRHHSNSGCNTYCDHGEEYSPNLSKIPIADVVEVVRCKDCIWFVPEHIKLSDGTTRPYTDEEKKLPCGVTSDIGINVGSYCLRKGYWEQNGIPVWFGENDFCSYGERRDT